jgi:enamine deaminase RidA (YjgF/YER057c/UK114 family)
MEQRAVNPWTWQDQFGFSQGIEVSGAQRMLICAGQTSSDENGATLHPGDMAAQIGAALDNVETVLRHGGYAFSDVVRLNYYTTDVDAFIAAGETLGARLAQHGIQPASTLLGVTRLAFPDLLVEIEATAVK